MINKYMSLSFSENDDHVWSTFHQQAAGNKVVSWKNIPVHTPFRPSSKPKNHKPTFFLTKAQSYLSSTKKKNNNLREEENGLDVIERTQEWD